MTAQAKINYASLLSQLERDDEALPFLRHIATTALPADTAARVQAVTVGILQKLATSDANAGRFSAPNLSAIVIDAAQTGCSCELATPGASAASPAECDASRRAFPALDARGPFVHAPIAT